MAAGDEKTNYAFSGVRLINLLAPADDVGRHIQLLTLTRNSDENESSGFTSGGANHRRFCRNGVRSRRANRWRKRLPDGIKQWRTD